MLVKLTVSEVNLLRLVCEFSGIDVTHLNAVDRELELNEDKKHHILKGLCQHIDNMKTNTYKISMIDMLMEEYEDENIEISMNAVFNIATNNINSALKVAENIMLKLI